MEAGREHFEAAWEDGQLALFGLPRVALDAHNVAYFDAVMEGDKGRQVTPGRRHISHDLDLLPVCLQVVEHQLTLTPPAVNPACVPKKQPIL